MTGRNKNGSEHAGNRSTRSSGDPGSSTNERSEAARQSGMNAKDGSIHGKEGSMGGSQGTRAEERGAASSREGSQSDSRATGGYGSDSGYSDGVRPSRERGSANGDDLDAEHRRSASSFAEPRGRRPEDSRERDNPRNDDASPTRPSEGTRREKPGSR